MLTRQSLPKLGFGPQGKKPVAGKFTLSPGSSLLCGSDGSEDLEIEGSIDNSEERFMSLIPEAKGDLHKIRELIAIASS